MPVPASAATYRRRVPEKDPLYQVLSQHLETFLEHMRAGDRRVPTHVECELRGYLECGILAYGFVRARCEDCGESRVVAFSCKRRMLRARWLALSMGAAARSRPHGWAMASMGLTDDLSISSGHCCAGLRMKMGRMGELKHQGRNG